MTVTVRHATITAVADDPAYDVGADEWNAYHTVTPPASDTSDDLITKNVGADNALNGNFRLAAHAYNVNAISGRWNQVYRLGYNMGESGGGSLSGEPSMGLHWESFYEQGGAELVEFHVSYFDSSAVEYRWDSWAHNRNTNVISRGSMFTDWSWINTSSTQVVKIDNGASAGSVVVDVFGASSKIRRDTNNAVFLQQKNAAGSGYIDLPYINDEDRIVLPGSLEAAGATPTTGTYANTFAALQPTSGVNNGIALDILGPTIASGAYNFINCAGSVSWEATVKVYNTNSSGTCARFWSLAPSGSCDPISLYSVNGVTDWCAGIDNSASDSYVVANNTTPGTNNALVIDTSLNAVFGGNVSTSNATNGQGIGLKSLTELLTIAAAATSTTTIQKPAHAIILGVSVRVTTAVTCTSTFTVGDSTNAARFSTAAVSKALNSTDKGTKAGAYYNATAEGIIITPDTVPSDATGRVRVTIHYLEVTPPTS